MGTTRPAATDTGSRGAVLPRIEAPWTRARRLAEAIVRAARGVTVGGVARRRAFAVRVQVPFAGRASVTLRSTRPTRRARHATLGRASVTLLRGRSSLVHVKLDRRAIALLRGRKTRARLTLSVSMSGAGWTDDDRRALLLRG